MYKFIAAFILQLFLLRYSLAQNIIISGKVLGSTGRPLKSCFAEVYKNNKFVQVKMEPDGSFVLKTDESCSLLRFSGVDHMNFQLPVLTIENHHIEFTLYLPALTYTDNFSKVSIIGNFNDWNRDHALPMQKDNSGIYYADIEADNDTVEYQLVGLSSSPTHSVNGTMSDAYKYDFGGDFHSVIFKKDKKIRIRFNPDELTYGSLDAGIAVPDSGKTESKILLREIETANRMMSIREKTDKNPETFPDMRDFLKDLNSKISEEKDEFMQQYYHMEYFRHWSYISSPRGLDSNMCRFVFEKIPANSPLWSYNPNILAVASFNYSDKKFYQNYINEVLKVSPDPEVKAEALYILLLNAKFNNDTASVNRYAARFLNELRNTRRASRVKSEFLTLKKGQPVPPFEVHSLENSSIKYSDKTLLGKTYLLDFWATWCGPCIGEIPNLQKAYEKYKSSNFEILSLSLDGREADIAKFRKNKYPMPWLHAFLDNGFGSEIAKRFFVTGIPEAVLISERGEIIASGGELRGEGLWKALEKHFLPVNK